jgi:hypothetical protein
VPIVIVAASPPCDDAGRAVFEVDTSSLDPGNYEIDTSLGAIGSGYSASTAQNATISLNVASTGGSYSLTWDESQIASQPGIACSADNCTFNVNATSSAQLTVETTPRPARVSVDYSTSSGAPASTDPGSG